MLENIYKSSWNEFPNRYKFIGLTINVDEVVKFTYRETYSFLNFFVDIGGFFICMKLFGFLFMRPIVRYNFLSLITNRMYIWENQKLKKTTMKSRFRQKKSFFENEVPIDIPHNLELYTCMSRCGCRCCLRRTNWKQYEEALQKVNLDINNNFDVTKLFTRLRMHGYAVEFLLNRTILKGIVKLSESKPIRYLPLT